MSEKRKELRAEPWETPMLNVKSQTDESAKQPEKKMKMIRSERKKMIGAHGSTEAKAEECFRENLVGLSETTDN